MKALLTALLLLNSSISVLWASQSQDIFFTQGSIGVDKNGLRCRNSTKYHRLPEVKELAGDNMVIRGLNSPVAIHDRSTEVTLARSSQEEDIDDKKLDNFIVWMFEQKRPFDINLMVDYLRTKKNNYTVFKSCARGSFGIEKEEHLHLLRDLCFLPQGKEREISGLKFHN